MYDPLTRTYSFACPHGREPRVPLSDFRMLERLLSSRKDVYADALAGAANTRGSVDTAEPATVCSCKPFVGGGSPIGEAIGERLEQLVKAVKAGGLANLAVESPQDVLDVFRQDPLTHRRSSIE